MTALAMVAAPLAGGIGAVVAGRWSRRGAAALAVTGTAMALALAILLAAGSPWSQPASSSGLTGGYDLLRLSTLVDGLTVCVALMVTVVATMVQIYSIGYLRGEERYPSYAAFVSLFVAAMLLVVVAGDLLTLVVGWEVMGLCSYLLIGHHWQRPEAQAASVKAFLVTKTGDVGFILGVVVLITTAGSSALTSVVTSTDLLGTSVGTAALLLLLVGVAGKSAQVPLQGWLPDAMAGPSPVSALIHAATMVAAGVYVVLRLYPLFLSSSAALATMAVVGGITMVGGAIAALAQDDLKRVLAWSTVSQLAYLVAALGVGGPEAATYHLLTHAFFKSLLFLAAGAVIHAVHSNLLTDMGGLRRTMPVTFATATVGLASLAGVPPLAGWFSKESVLAAAEATANGETSVAPWSGWWVLVVGLLTVALTGAYCWRLWSMTFLRSPRSDTREARDPEPSMWWPLVVLSVPAALLGVSGLSATWLPTWIADSAWGDAVAEPLRPTPITSVGSLVALALGVGWSVWAGRSGRTDPALRLGRLRPVLREAFGMDAAYRVVAVAPFDGAVRAVRRTDRSLSALVRGIGGAAQTAGRGIQRGHDGDVQRGLGVAMTLLVAVVVVVVVAVVS